MVFDPSESCKNDSKAVTSKVKFMYNVLHIMAGADAGGISTVVLNYYRFIDREKIHFDVAVTTDAVGQNGERLQKLGVEIYRLPLKSKGIIEFQAALTNILKKKHYSAIHVHENETSYVALRVAKQQGIQCRFAHAHVARPCVPLKECLRIIASRTLNYYYATKVIACGELAGQYVFGKKHMQQKKSVVLPNAVDTEIFFYNESERVEIRKELGVENQYVLGMIGRLSEQKNYPYALDLMKRVHEQVPDSVLVIAGNGEKEEELKQIIKEMGMSKYVKLLGQRGDVARLYQAFDVFLLPSLYEGFPVVAVEAMACGLPVLLSTTITTELKFGTAVRYLDLEDTNAWIRAIKEYRNNVQRECWQHEVKKNGLDLRATAKILEGIYLEGYNC